ncbi:MAG: hypothetical protein ACR2QO_15520 [Acidimicrobiales bacterium]
MSLIEIEPLTGRTTPVAELTADERQQMYELLERYYENVDRRSFDDDLAQKRWAVLAIDHAGVVRGFSTQQLVSLASGGHALFSGDTVVDRAYWGRNPIASEWGRLALEVYGADPDRELFWFLIAKGYKTYRLLTTYFVEYYPRLGAMAPAWAAALTDELGMLLFPERYDPNRAIVVAGPGDQRLRQDVAPVGIDQLTDPSVGYFDLRNPGHRSGDELCCIARLNPANLNDAALALIASRC